MDFVPIKIENSSQSGRANGQNFPFAGKSRGEDQGPFDSMLSEFLNRRSETLQSQNNIDTETEGSKATRSKDRHVAVPENATPRREISHPELADKSLATQVIDLKNLNAKDRTKLTKLIAGILESLKGDAKGKKILKAWEQGKLQILVPVDVKQTDTSGKQGFLLIQPDSKDQGKQQISVQSLFSYTLLVGNLGKDTNGFSFANQSGTAGLFQINKGQILFESAGAEGGKTPLILFSGNKKADEFATIDIGNGQNDFGVGNRQNTEESIKAGRLAAQRNTSRTTGSQEQKENPTAKLVYILKDQKSGAEALNRVSRNSNATAIHGKSAILSEGQTLGKGLSGEIAGLLESLKGEMKVKSATRKGTLLSVGDREGGESKGTVKVSVPGRSTISQAQKKVTLAGQPAKHNQQTNSESSFSGGATKDFGKEVMRLDGNQVSEGQSTALNQLMQKPVTEVFANGQPKVPLYQVIQKIEAMVQAAKAQQSLNQPQALKAQLVLHPKHLGSLHLNLQYHDDTLSGTILAASKETKLLIEHSLPALKQALHAQHTMVNHLDVEVRSDLPQDNAQNWFLQEQANQQRRQRGWTGAEFQGQDIDAAQVLAGPDIIPANHKPDYSGNGRLELYA